MARISQKRQDAATAESMITAKWIGKAYGINRRLETTKYGHIYSSRVYKGFKRGLEWVLYGANPQHLTYKCPVRVDIDYTISRQRDIDSLTKPVLDALQNANIILNDSMAVDLRQRKHIKKRGELDEIEIRVQEADDGR